MGFFDFAEKAFDMATTVGEVVEDDVPLVGTAIEGGKALYSGGNALVDALEGDSNEAKKDGSSALSSVARMIPGVGLVDDMCGGLFGDGPLENEMDDVCGVDEAAAKEHEETHEGSSVGGEIGMALGSVAGPLGMAIGGWEGEAIGSLFD